jgi:hypothetical protein
MIKSLKQKTGLRNTELAFHLKVNLSRLSMAQGNSRQLPSNASSKLNDLCVAALTKNATCLQLRQRMQEQREECVAKARAALRECEHYMYIYERALLKLQEKHMKYVHAVNTLSIMQCEAKDDTQSLNDMSFLSRRRQDACCETKQFKLVLKMKGLEGQMEFLKTIIEEYERSLM